MTRAPRVLIVADDLTGAMDSAAPFAARGIETWVAALPLRCDPAAFASAQVVAINTDSRHLAGRQAAARVRRIARYLGIDGFDVVVKKIDSTLRGNVVDETLALLDVSGRHEAVIAPAFPAQGRTVRDGIVHVDGTPLAQTNFAKDALSPPPLVRLQQLFASAGRGLRVAAVAPSDGFVSGGGTEVWIADSASDADLATIAATLSPRLESVLVVGSAGIARALATGCFELQPPLPAPPCVSGPLVFAVGSRAACCAGQVEALATEPGTRVVHAPNGKVRCTETAAAPGAEISVGLNLVLNATEGDAGPGDSKRVAAALGRYAIDAARRTKAQALVATGGDTALALLAASDQPSLRVLGELMPGIPYARIDLGGATALLVTKAGGFGAPEIFREIARHLRGT